MVRKDVCPSALLQRRNMKSCENDVQLTRHDDYEVQTLMALP